MFHIGCGPSISSGIYFLNKTMKNISELNIFIRATMTVHMMVDLHVQVDIDTFFCLAS